MLEMGREHVVSQVENSDLNLYDVREWRTQKMMLRYLYNRFLKTISFSKAFSCFLCSFHIWHSIENAHQNENRNALSYCFEMK